MITDRTFKFTRLYYESESTNGFFGYFSVKDGEFFPIYEDIDEEKYECVELFMQNISVNSINLLFEYYEIPVHDGVVAKRCDGETATFISKQFPNEVLLVKATKSTIVWYSDVCSDQLKTMIELMGN